VLISPEDQQEEMRDIRVGSLNLIEKKLFLITCGNIFEYLKDLNKEVLGFLSEVSGITFIDFFQNIKDAIQAAHLFKDFDEIYRTSFRYILEGYFELLLEE